MVDFKKVKAPNNPITRTPAVLAAKADNNIYEAVAIIAKRSNQPGNSRKAGTECRCRSKTHPLCAGTPLR